MTRFMKFGLIVFASLLFNQPANAQNASGKTILVLDASGSMWGQIDGITKIEIAQSVIDDLLKNLPDDQELGLTAYGHNRKGDCSDIETLVAPVLHTKEAISKAVNAIKPKGKTPLSEAVIKAAEALKFTEDKATVILISDGRETCDFNPCEVGKKLEESGVDFTAHVVGFDVSNPADRAQLQCLAENTGGEFLTASNASELTKALQKVSAPLPPEPRKITFRAVEADTEKPIVDNLVWTLTNTGTNEVVVNPEGMPQIDTMLLPGKYKAEVLRTTDEATGELNVGIFKNTNTLFNVELPPYLPKATVDAIDQAPVGASISVDWTGPNGKGDYVTITEIDARPSHYKSYAYTKEGTPLQLQMPAEPRDYQLRYVLRDGSKIIAVKSIVATPVQASLDTVQTAIAGDSIVINWTGPDYKSDYISVAKAETVGNHYEKYTYTRKGSPLRLQMPTEPGDYEIRYVMSHGSTVIAARPITITNVSASLKTPDVATAGENIVVEWEGPDYQNDYIDVAEPTLIATKQTKYINYVYTKNGSPLRLKMPVEPGDYVIRYVVSQNTKIIAKRPIRIKTVNASLDVPSTANIGEALVVNWNGPDYKNDYISVATPDAKGSKYLYYTYTKQGSPLRLKMPLNPGQYEIRYIVNQGNTIKAKQTITLEAVDITLEFPETAKIAEPFLINWQGPDYNSDYIAVAEIGTDDHTYINYVYTKQGAQLRLAMPPKPGQYEIRYIANGNPDKALARKLVTVESVPTDMKIVGDATAAQLALIEWAGPNYKSDYIGVGEIGTEKYLSYTYTHEGSPLRLKMPDKPGIYELRYYLRQGTTIIARQQIEVK